MATKKRDPGAVSTKAGSGKSAITIVWDMTTPPTRNASLSTRLLFAAQYLRRFLDGATANKKTMELCVKWVSEAAAAAPVK
jgi:hypothetical protein